MLQIIWEVPTETQITKTNLRRDRTCNRSISTKEPELVINLVKKKKKISTKESPEPKSFTGELYQMFKEELTMFHKLFKKKKKRRDKFPNHWWGQFCPDTKNKRHHKERILQNISYNYVFKNPQ